jgi:nucleotide-binding universal stress UspA family protein
MQLRKILCAVDFSDHSRAAMEFACDLAARTHTPLVLVYVWQPPVWVTANPAAGLGTAIQDVIDADQSSLDTWVADARRAGVADVSSRFLQGTPWASIVDEAKRDPEIDLIVIGTHGRTGIKAALLGSVAEKVVRHAPCRVLVTRERGEQPACA